MLIGWSHRYKHYIVTISYPYLKWQLIFYFLRRCFLSSLTSTIFTGLDGIYMCMSNGGCLIRSRNSFSFASTRVHPGFSVGSRVHLLVFCVLSYYLSLHSGFLVGMSVTISAQYRCSALFYLQLLVGRLMFVFVLYILCCQCVWIVYFWLPLWYPLTFILEEFWTFTNQKKVPIKRYKNSNRFSNIYKILVFTSICWDRLGKHNQSEGNTENSNYFFNIKNGREHDC